MTADLGHILEYWDREDVESMYDKHLLNAEIELIRRRLAPGSKILDAGCGEGEGTLAYSMLPGAKVHAVDFSATRLRKAQACVAGRGNVTFQQVDFLKPYRLDRDFDAIVSQRFLINLPEWELQGRVLLELMEHLKPGGRLLMLEGSQPGVDELNGFRAACGLEPIPVKWHNLFFDDEVLVGFMREHGYPLAEVDGLGSYLLLTRGVRPLLDAKLDWNCEFNARAASPAVDASLRLGARFSRLKLWVFRK
mgnify:CR=1 FL=1